MLKLSAALILLLSLFNFAAQADDAPANQGTAISLHPVLTCSPSPGSSNVLYSRTVNNKVVSATVYSISYLKGLDQSVAGWEVNYVDESGGLENTIFITGPSTSSASGQSSSYVQTGSGSNTFPTEIVFTLNLGTLTITTDDSHNVFQGAVSTYSCH